MSISDRILADIRKSDEWHAAREGRIGASDAARFAKFASADSYTRTKLMPSWSGSLASGWGHEREDIILAQYGYDQNHLMFSHETFTRHAATPDGIKLGPVWRLGQAKTTSHDWISKRTGEVLVPPNYRRQCWWEQWVMGPEFTQTDLIYERHENYVPDFDAKVVVIDRDDAEIAKLVAIANEVLRRLDLATI